MTFTRKFISLLLLAALIFSAALVPTLTLYAEESGTAGKDTEISTLNSDVLPDIDRNSDGEYTGKTDGTPASSVAEQAKNEAEQIKDDVMDSAKKAAPGWVSWLALGALVLAVIALAVSCANRPRKRY